MANKIYTVVKDGEELEKLKTLAAAKKLADAEGAEVYCDGKCVYEGTGSPVEDKTAEEKPEEKTVEAEKRAVEAEKQVLKANDVEKAAEGERKEIVTAVPVISGKPKQPDVPEPATEKNRLKSLMNIRKKPSLDSTIIGTRPEGTVVRVLSIENDWLHLANDGYILYGNGKWAEKIV